MPPVPRLEAMARIGFAARGVMYVMIGLLALLTGRDEDGAGAMAHLGSGAGRILLGAMALGFLGYGAWRLAEALFDTEGHGGDARGLVVRIAGAGSGILHLGLALIAAKLAAGSGRAGGDSAEQGARAALELPGGTLLLLVAAAVLAAAGVAQIVKAVRADFLRHLDAGVAARARIRMLGRAGFAARGIVFLIMAWFLLEAGLEGRSSRAGGVDDALAALSPTVHAIVAAGLLLFGLFSFVEARHRRITDPKVLARLRSHVTRAAGG